MYGTPDNHIGPAFVVDYGEMVDADGFILRNSNNRDTNTRYDYSATSSKLCEMKIRNIFWLSSPYPVVC